MIHKNAVGKTDPHRLSPVRGPSSELEAHIDSCSFDELPEYAAKVRSIKKEPYFAVDLFSGAGGLSLGLHLSLIHISEPTRPLYISYAVFCLKKKK